MMQNETTQRRFRGALLTVVASLVTAAFVYWQVKPVDLPQVHILLLRALAPVSLDIEYAPVVTEPAPGVVQLEGPIRYTFTNTADRPVKLAFPPLRLFSISQNHASQEVHQVPRFSKERRAITLAPGQTISFEDRYADTIIGFNPSYFNGGIGFTGFVFGVPEGEDLDDFCTGSLFPTYRIVEKLEK